MDVLLSELVLWKKEYKELVGKTLMKILMPHMYLFLVVTKVNLLLLDQTDIFSQELM